jgi:hypothetical protein
MSLTGGNLKDFVKIGRNLGHDFFLVDMHNLAFDWREMKKKTTVCLGSECIIFGDKRKEASSSSKK